MQIKPASFFVVNQDARGIAVEIVILSAVERPQQHNQRAQSEQQGGGDDEGDTVHAPLPPASRRAFSVTTSEEPAIAAAAINGVTNPSAANGIAAAL